MACAMIYWGANYDDFFEIFLEFGAVVDLRDLLGKTIGDRNALKQASLFKDARFRIASP